jgi:hypothetical protein
LTVATASEINKHIREDQTMYNLEWVIIGPCLLTIFIG